MARREASGEPIAQRAAPPLVHQVLSSPGRPLQTALRARLEADFPHVSGDARSLGTQHLDETLSVGAADDPLEAEADHVARQLIRQNPPNEVPKGRGADFSSVRIHDDTLAAASARALAARAYTVGEHVVFGAGEYQPSTSGGLHLLAHELVHVRQQGRAAQRTLQRQDDGSAAGADTAGPAPGVTALSVTFDGLIFRPRGLSFEPGSRMRQGLGVALQRLIADAYEPGVVDRLIAELAPAPYGQLVGDAVERERMLQFTINAPLALRVVGWLDGQGYDVALSEQQRDVLTLAVFASAAWRDLQTQTIAAEIGVALPAWYGESMFRREMPDHVALLRRYVAGVEAFRATHAAPARQDAVDALRDIVNELSSAAQVLETIRTDAGLIADPAYRLLWPPPAPASTAPGAASAPAASPLPAVMADASQQPDGRFGGLFLSFVHTQPQIAAEALEEHAARQTLLARFLRFIERGLTPAAAGDQAIHDRPGRANTPPIPSSMSAYPALEPPLFDAALDTDHVFDMSLSYSDVFEAFLRYSYDWTYVRVPDESVGRTVDPESLSAQRQGWGATASARFRRAGRYAVADVERSFGGIIGELGTPGVGAIELASANAILRFVGAGIRLAFEILATPQNEKHLVFPEAGLYIVRCKALPVLEGDEELVRVPSVAYLPVFARNAEDMARSRTEQASTSRASALDRVLELQGMLAEPVSWANQDALEEELRQLTAALGSTDDVLREQVRLLERRRDTLPGNSAERRLIERQLEDIQRRLEVRAARSEDHALGRAERLNATFVSDVGQVVRLALEAVDETAPGAARRTFWVSDLTTPNSSQATGSGDTRAEAILAAVRSILEGISGYGRGAMSLELDGELRSLRIEASMGSLLLEAMENVSTALSLAAVVAAPFTGGASLVLLVPAGVLGAIPSGYRLVSRAIDDTLRLDLQTATDIVNIVGTLVGLGGELAIGLRTVRLGSALMITGIGLDALNMLMLGAGIIEQIAALEGLPPGVRLARVMEIMGQAMMQAGIAVGATVYHTGRAREARAGDERSGSEPSIEGGTSEPRADLSPPEHAPAPEHARDPALAEVHSQERVRIGGEEHSLRVQEEGGQLVIELCTDCRALRTQIERVLGHPDTSALPPDVQRRLQRLHHEAGRLEREMNAGRVTHEGAAAECDRIAGDIDALATAHPDALGPLVGVPRGFRDSAHFGDFGAHVAERLRGLVSYFEAYIQGSSVTGRSYHEGRPYGPHSDVDLAIVSTELFELVHAGGGDIREGVHTEPNPAQLAEILNPLRQELSALMGGREVNVMVYDTRRGLFRRGDNIQVPTTHGGGP